MEKPSFVVLLDRFSPRQTKLLWFRLREVRTNQRFRASIDDFLHRFERRHNFSGLVFGLQLNLQQERSYFPKETKHRNEITTDIALLRRLLTKFEVPRNIRLKLCSIDENREYTSFSFIGQFRGPEKINLRGSRGEPSKDGFSKLLFGSWATGL